MIQVEDGCFGKGQWAPKHGGKLLSNRQGFEIRLTQSWRQDEFKLPDIMIGANERFRGISAAITKTAYTGCLTLVSFGDGSSLSWRGRNL